MRKGNLQMENWVFHEELKLLNIEVYKFNTLNKGDRINGKNLEWKVISKHFDPKTNFKGVAFTNGNNLVFSFVGTENNYGNFTKSWSTNIIDMGLRNINKQFSAGEKWVESFLYSPKYRNYHKYATGHSEAGTESVLYAKKYGIDAVTFNAYNARQIVEHSPITFNHNPHIINYGFVNDVTFKLGGKPHLGDTYLFYDSNSKSKFELSKLHALENFPALNSGYKYEPTKIDVPYHVKAQEFSSESIGLSNSAGVAEQLIEKVDPTKIAITALPIVMPTPSVFGAVMNMVTPLANIGLSAFGSWTGGALLGKLAGEPTKGVGNGAANSIGKSLTKAVGNKTLQNMGTMLSVYGKMMNGMDSMRYHTGGVIPGEGDVMTILKGGETVRTKAQEKELQERLYKNYGIAPMVCGEPIQPQEPTQTQKNQKSLHQQITREDENFFINLIADAIDRNRLGLRVKLQSL